VILPGYEASAKKGSALPEHACRDCRKLNSAISAVLANPRSRTRLGRAGGSVISGSPADFGKLIADETEKVGQGGEVLGREAGVIQQSALRYSINPDSNCALCPRQLPSSAK